MSQILVDYLAKSVILPSLMFAVAGALFPKIEFFFLLTTLSVEIFEYSLKYPVYEFTIFNELFKVRCERAFM